MEGMSDGTRVFGIAKLGEGQKENNERDIMIEVAIMRL